MKNWMSYSFYSKKIFLELVKKNVCCWKQNMYHFENDKKKFLQEMLVWIKNDQDSVTRRENLQKDMDSE